MSHRIEVERVTAWTEHRYAVIDIEGNGQQPPDLVELGMVPIVSGVIGAPVTWLCKPERPSTPLAQRIHGIRAAMVDAAPSFSEVAADIRAHLDGAMLVAHNAGVDMGVLRRKMPGACCLTSRATVWANSPGRCRWIMSCRMACTPIEPGTTCWSPPACSSI